MLFPSSKPLQVSFPLLILFYFVSFGVGVRTIGISDGLIGKGGGRFGGEAFERV